MTNATDGLQLQSLVKASGELEVSLVRIPTPEPAADEIVVRVEATPINPSDLGLMFARGDMSGAKFSGTAANPVVTAAIPPRGMEALAARVDKAMPVGNEGAGTVIAAGSSPEAQALLGKMVAMLAGGMYAQYRVVKAASVMALQADATAADGASCFVNPLTALAMVEVMRREGHKALVHTAAASNLGQMLVKICLKDGVDLVNIVRSPEQAKILKDLGAVYVVDTSAASFMSDLVTALTATGATLAFDAIGGGVLGSQILGAMDQAAAANMTAFSVYGSTTLKQLYIYGGLDISPTQLNRNFGFAWAVSGFLIMPFLQKIGPEDAGRLRQRVVTELKTTFASHYTAEISLAEALRPEMLAAYSRRATGEKYLINPSKA
jgi:NADPH2:quinone reductase